MDNENLVNIWIPDEDWVELPSPKRCRSIDGTPRKHCPNWGNYALKRSNGYWAYCPDHMYGRRIIEGIVHIQIRRPRKEVM